MLRVTAAIFVAISFSALAKDQTNCGPNVGQVSPSYGCSASLAQNAIAPDALPPLTGKESGDVKAPVQQAVPDSFRVGPGQMLMIKVPANPTEMLENIKLALAEDLFLREEFYGNANINKVFGVAKGYGIIWRENKASQKHGDYPYPIPPFEVPPPNPTNFVQSGFVNWTIGYDEKKQRIRAIVGFALTSFNVDVVQGVFGKPDEMREGGASLPPPHGLPAYMRDPKKHPLGNSNLIYKMTDATTEKTVSFRTNGSGQVLDLQIVEEQR